MDDIVSKFKVGVVIPAYDEENVIAGTVKGLLSQGIEQVVVVDNASSNSTKEVAAKAGAKVIEEPLNGYGWACEKGYSALDSDTDVVVFMRADGRDNAKNIPLLLRGIYEGADVVCTARSSKDLQIDAGWWLGRMASWFMGLRMGIRTGQYFKDVGPLRTIRYKDFRRLRLMEKDILGWNLQMQLQAVLKGLIVIEVPVPVNRPFPRVLDKGSSRSLGKSIALFWRLNRIISRA